MQDSSKLKCLICLRDLLFKIVENAHAFSEEFVAKCVKEIEEIMTIPEEVKKDTNTEE